MTDGELRAFFGLPERALYRLRLTNHFPRRDELIGKTDRRAVERFFDRRAGLVGSSYGVPDGEENWEGI